ncbi:unnamed protein product [Protopolystoma xenopodis]|uniref:Aminoacyl-tRNA synthetase class II (D/K/N) domain-containing protein n=1 Tax=Protopolystoma xenopodis TaxID=117903 RepID=A0A3S5AE51_9PLAT|nr:unnamed protein product [Protopolystoma xenopodis]
MLVQKFLSVPSDKEASITTCSAIDALLHPDPFPRITFAEAMSYLESKGTKDLHPSDNPSDKCLSREDEQNLIKWVSRGDILRPIFLTHFPSSIKPFYCSLTSHSKDLTESVDLLVPGVGELVGGSVREMDFTKLKARCPGFKEGTPSENYTTNLDWYLSLRGLGNAPHAGFGLGFERFLQFIWSVYNIRDLVPIPREIGKIYL